MKKYYLILFCFISIYSSAQNLTRQQNRTVNRLFKHKTEIYFTFQITDRSEINTLTRIISIDNVKDLQVWAVANKEEFKKFIILNYNYTILPNANSNAHNPMGSLRSPQSHTPLTAYPTYQQYETMMANFAVTYPSICKLVLIGTLPSGHRLLALKISSNVNVHQDKPQFLYTSTMHADETAGYIGMLDYADYLLSNYGTNTRVTNLVNSIEIWINPLANPDGCYKGGDNTVNGAVRYNANNVDLNRNYPDPQAGQHPDGNAWQPETVAFMHFADSLNLTMSANFHGGSEVVNYPWDTWTRLHADNNWYVRESAKYADTAQANAAAGYFTSVNANGITDGYAWYQVTGGRQESLNYYKHCREVTIELSNTKLIPTTDFTNKWNANSKSYLNYMQECLHGFRGIVTDSCSGLPLKAKVFITGHDVDSSHVYSTSSIGDYHRPIYQGTYSVTFSASGYVSKTINNVVVTDMNSTRVDVALRPSVMPLVSASITSIDTIICQGTTAVFNANAVNGGGSPVYQWQVNGSNAGTNSSTFSSSTLANGSTITCHITSSNTCVTNNPASSNTIHLIVNPLPATPIISQAGAVLNSNSATGNQWYNSSSGSISGATVVSYSPSASGNYFVIVTDANSCSSDTSNIIHFISSGITALNDNSSIQVYPNPCNEELFIDVINKNASQNITVEIYNTLGEQLYSEKSAENKLRINCRIFSSGIYFLNITDGNIIHKEKIVVNNKN